MRRIRDALFVGPSATFLDVPRLRAEDMTAILSLQTIGPDVPAAAIERLRTACTPDLAFELVSMRDYDPADVTVRLPEVFTTLRRLFTDGRVVYLCCSLGVNRAPSVALAWLVLEDGFAVDAALAHLREGSPPPARRWER